MMTKEQLAKACSEAMHKKDYAAQLLSIEIVSSTPGQAVLQMKVRQEMLNGHAICHGGFLFALCDTAFAHACNNGNKNTVASGCTIDFLSPAYEGDVLSATAKECYRSRHGRTGVYQVQLHNQEDKLIALFQGKSTQIKGSLIQQS